MKAFFRVTIFGILFISTSHIYADYRCGDGVNNTTEFRTNVDGTTTIIMRAIPDGELSTAEVIHNAKIIAYIAKSLGIVSEVSEFGRERVPNAIQVIFPYDQKATEKCQWEETASFISLCDFHKKKVRVELLLVDPFWGHGYDDIAPSSSRIGEGEAYVIFRSSIQSRTFWSKQTQGVISKRSVYESSFSIHSPAVDGRFGFSVDFKQTYKHRPEYDHPTCFFK